jgi:hypothetical protein
MLERLRALSADTRMVQNGPARAGWVPPALGGGAGRGVAPAGRGRGDSTPERDAEPVIGLPGRGGRGQSGWRVRLCRKFDQEGAA